MVRSLAFLLLLATSLKLAILLAPGVGLYFHGDMSLQLFNPEEIHRGTTTMDLIDGLLMPFSEYQYAHFFGGSQVVSLLAVPFFWMFGPCLFALKLTGLVFNALMVTFVFLILDRLAGRRAAWFGGLLASLPAPGYVALTLTAFGTHMEHNAISMGIVYLYLLIFEPRDESQSLASRGWLLFLLGVACGFGIYFGYIILITLLVLFLHRALRAPAFFMGRPFAVLLLGFVVGLLPWLQYNLGHDFKGLMIYGVKPGAIVISLGDRLAALPGRLQSLLGNIFPTSAFFKDFGPVDATWLNRLFIGMLVLLAVLATRRVLVRASAGPDSRLGLLKSPLGIMIAYPVLFFLFTSASTLMGGERHSSVVFHRYVYVLYPYLFLAAGLGMERLWRHGRALRAAGLGALAVLLCFGVAGGAVLVEPSNWGVMLDAPAYSRQQLGRFLALKFEDQPEIVAHALARSSRWSNSRERHRLHFGVCIHYQKRWRSPAQDKEVFEAQVLRLESQRKSLLETVGEPFRPYFQDKMPLGRKYRLIDFDLFRKNLELSAQRDQRREKRAKALPIKAPRDQEEDK